MPADRRDRLYQLGRDTDVGALRRGTARLLSAYERAPLRLVLGSEAVGPLDDGIVGVLAAGLTGSRVFTSPLVTPMMNSGWRGNLLFLGVWITALAGIVLLLARAS